MADNIERLLRMTEVAALVGLDRATIYRMIEAGRFPAGRQIGDRAVAWLSSELTEWMRSRPTAAMAGTNPVTRPRRRQEITA